ncbi:MAG: hypothetical protein AAF570_20220 [Bacteroidota bacterium]
MKQLPPYRLIFSSTLLLCLLLGALGCNSDQCDPDLPCFYERPDSGFVHLNLTINGDNPLVPIAIYEGAIDDSILLVRDTVPDTDVFYYLAADQRYSASARYREAQLTILAVDGDRIRTRRETNCDEVCFTIEDAFINLTLQR